MSYILDALDKAEQDRQHKKAPNLKTAHTVVTEPGRIHTGLWITVLILVTLSLALIVYQSRDWIWSPEPILVGTRVKSTALSAPTSLVSAGDLDKGSLAPLDIEAPEESRSVPIQKQPEVSKFNLANNTTEQLPVVPEITEILSINDLPLSIQRQIPDLTFSTHIYASDAAWRMVGINGKSHKQGDIVAGNLVLQEITEQGVVLGFEGYSFTISILKNWSSQ
ncbi:MAG: general secretion pathway protein GspB [Gammaproteobacteria bacterium]|nr:general secretion pathway protein GspB [Gammaproteobacteria bacterium]